MHNDLHRLEQRWSMAVQGAGFGVWDLDPRREQVHYSPQWKGMLGYAESNEPDGTDAWRSRVHPDDLQPMKDALFGHLEGREPVYETEFRLRTHGGGWRWVLSRGRVFERDAQGQALRMIGSLTDLTGHREVQSARAAREIADAANRAKAEFLSHMSHQLRTPLNAVLGFAQLLAAQVGSSDIVAQRCFVGHIEKAGWQLVSMIDDVLDLSHAASGKLRVDTRPVALVPLLHAALETVGEAAAARAIEIRLTPPPADAMVLADPQRLMQVFTSLLKNAITYNRESGSVDISVGRSHDAWRVSFDDSGVGIAADRLPELFEPFNRLGGTRSTVDGMGIGLVLTRWLLDQMGGRLNVRSTEGVGSTFDVTMPLAGAASSGHDQPAATDRVHPQGTGLLGDASSAAPR